MGLDLGAVRVHGGAAAETLASGHRAHAFTFGNHVVLGRNAQRATSSARAQVLAHELVHVGQQTPVAPSSEAPHRPRARAPPSVQRLPEDDTSIVPAFVSDLATSVSDVIPDLDSILDAVRDQIRAIPGYIVLTYVAGTDPLSDEPVPATPLELVEKLLTFGPFGAAVGTVLEAVDVLGEVFAFLKEGLETHGLTYARIEGDIGRAWGELSVTEGIAGNVAIVRRYIDAFLSDLLAFVESIAERVLEMVRAVLARVAEPLLQTDPIGPVWSLAKKVMHYDPLRGEDVNAPTAEIIADFLRLIGQEQRLAQMEDRGTLQETADWLDTQFLIFAGLIVDVGMLFSDARAAIQPENLPNLLNELPALAQRTYGLVLRVADFATTVIAKILELIKNALLGWLSEYAGSIPGFNLLTVIAGVNPFTGAEVQRTAENLIRGFITLMPGGEAIYDQLAQTGVIADAAARIEEAITALGITPELVVGTFRGIWDTFTLDDLLDPISAFVRVLDLFGEPLLRLVQFVGVVIEVVVTLVLRLMNFPSELLANVIANTKAAITDIQRDPVGFLLNMMEALKAGFLGFFENIGKYLLDGLVAWLFRGLGQLGITLPTDYSLGSILNLIFQVLGLSIEHLWEKLAQHIPPERVAMIRDAIDTLTGVWTFVQDVQREGLSAVWTLIQDQLSAIWQTLLQTAMEWVMTQLITSGMIKLLSFLDPTFIMSVVNGCIALFNAVQAAIEYARDMLEILNLYVGTLAQVAAGNIAPGAEMIEAGLAAAIPMAIGFLAYLLGIDDVPKRIADIVLGIREAIDSAIDWLIEQALRLGAAALSALGLGGEAEAEAEKVEELDPKDHEAVGRRVVDALREAVVGTDYASARAQAEERARALETQYTSLLEPGVGLRVEFATREADDVDQDIDFNVVIAPNTERVPGTIQITASTEGGDLVYTVWILDELKIEISADPDRDPELTEAIRSDAGPAAITKILMGKKLEMDKNGARAFLEELQKRGVLTGVPRLLISFAQTGPDPPLDYLRNNLRLGLASRAAREIPTGLERHQMVERGTEEGEQRVSLASYASVFWESYVGQFVSEPLQKHGGVGGMIANELRWHGEDQPRVQNLGIVRVDDNGNIDEIVEATALAGGVTGLIKIMKNTLPKWRLKEPLIVPEGT